MITNNYLYQTYSRWQSTVPQTEKMKTVTRLYSAIYFCGGFDIKPL